MDRSEGKGVPLLFVAVSELLVSPTVLITESARHIIRGL